MLVTNEVGMGLVPETELGRSFRDVAGRAHQQLAQVADEIYFAALGVMLRLRPGPVTAVQGSEFGVPDERQQRSRNPEPQLP
ncbi:MAG: bifunctional adenosylcobinamide kinase/adenosylcobinamide-phosphate guanylyltransferase [Caulobacterales bacterium]